jgi:3-hydroxybutyryl-CoA dehydrogenase
MAAATKRPQQVLGLHFFNPVPLMKLVEVARTILTDEATVATATEWVGAVGKVPVQTKDSTAFIVNRLLVPYLLDAIRLYEGGLASLEDIDQALKLGCGYPMGPFTLLDLVGLDTTMFVAEVMFDEFREPRYAPPPLLKRMVMAGRLGRKTGRGFHPPTAWRSDPMSRTGRPSRRRSLVSRSGAGSMANRRSAST